jgi:hypothetical protein
MSGMIIIIFDVKDIPTPNPSGGEGGGERVQKTGVKKITGNR